MYSRVFDISDITWNILQRIPAFKKRGTIEIIPRLKIQYPMKNHYNKYKGHSNF